jgi:lactate permease
MPSGLALPAALAAAPIALILVLMLAARRSAAVAGGAALALALALLALDGGFTLAVPVEPGDAAPAPAAAAVPLRALAGVFAEGGFLTLTILWILGPALALHRLQQTGGAVDALRDGLARLAPAPALQALLIGWLLALFFEGAAGFGTPVALAAPLLVGLGFAPVPAVVLALLGHAAGVSFGALGTPVLAQAGLTGLDPVAIAGRTALMHTLLGGFLMVFFVHALAVDGHRPAARWAALAAAGFLLPSLGIAAWLGPELATIGAAIIGGALFVASLRRSAVAVPLPPSGAGLGRDAHLALALAPYAVLIVLVLLTRAWPSVAAALGSVSIEWSLLDGRFGARLQPLTHPGTLLLVALVVGALVQRRRAGELAQALAHAARRLLPVAAALGAMLCLSRLMLHAGMVDALERAAVAGVGQAWPWVAPAVGALGSFVTGSATASNVLFTTLQVRTADALAMPAVTLVAAQGFGAAIGNIVCPHNIVAGAATVGLAGREGEILRRTLVPCVIYLAAGGALVAALVRWG